MDNKNNIKTHIGDKGIGRSFLIGTMALLLLISGCSRHPSARKRLQYAIAHYKSETTTGWDRSQLVIRPSILATLKSATLRSLRKAQLCYVELHDHPIQHGALISGGILVFWVEDRPTPNEVRIYSTLAKSFHFDIPIPEYQIKANKILQNQTVVFSCVVSLKSSQQALNRICSAAKSGHLFVGLLNDGKLCSNTIKPSLVLCKGTVDR